MLILCTNLYAARNEQFGNAREMRNMFESAVRNQSTRLVASGQCDHEALTTLLPEDVPENFETGLPAPAGIKPAPSLIAARPGLNSNRHSLNLFGNQIVIGVADDFDFRKFANRQLAAHINTSINVRRIGFAASDEIMALHLARVLVGFANQAVFP